MQMKTNYQNMWESAKEGTYREVCIINCLYIKGKDSNQWLELSPQVMKIIASEKITEREKIEEEINAIENNQLRKIIEI